jgi:hypothetical protein
VNPWNREETFEDDTERWTDRRMLRVWQSNNAGSGSNRGLFPNSGGALYPAMSINPSNGDLYGSFVRHNTLEVYYATNSGTSNMIKTHKDDFDYTDIHYSSAGRPTVAYTYANGYTLTTDTYEKTGGMLLYDRDSLSYSAPLTGSGGRPAYMAESVWRTSSDHILDRFENPRVVTNRDLVHVSYYDRVDQSLKYWFNPSGLSFDATAYRNPAYKRKVRINGNQVGNMSGPVTGTPGDPSGSGDVHTFLPRHWVNLDGGWNRYDDGYIVASGGTQYAQPRTRATGDRGGIDNHGTGANPTLDVNVSAGAHNAIDITSAGHPVIAYTDMKKQNLRLIIAKNMTPNLGSDWNAPVEITPPNSLTGQFVSIKISASNVIHLAYYNSGSSTLEYLRGTISGSSASFPSPAVTIDRNGVVGKWADISLDHNGNPYITCLDMAQSNAITGGYGAVKMAFMPDPAASWTNGKNWETMTSPLRFRGKDARLSIENRPGANPDPSGIFWKAAIGYAASDAFRIAYYVE